MTPFWQQPWFWPAIVVIVGLPVVLLVLTELQSNLQRRGNSLHKVVGLLRNAVIPVIALAAVQFGFMLGGSIVIEAVFSLQGLGQLAWESIARNDFPVVQAIVLVLAMIYIALTLAADLLNAFLDPRLRQ